MKTRHFLLAALALLCSTTLFTACGSDDDDDITPSKPDDVRVYVALWHYTQLTEDMLNYCKVEVTTIAADGYSTTHVVTKADIKNNAYMATVVGKLPCDLKVKRTVTLLDENIDVSTISSIQYYGNSNYIKYVYYNTNKELITNAGGEGGATHLSPSTVTSEKGKQGFVDMVKKGHFNADLTFSFDKDGKLAE